MEDKGGVVKTVPVDEARLRLAELMDYVVSTGDEVVMTAEGREPVVMLSLRQLESLKEFVYLTRSPRNAQRISESIERLRPSSGVGGR